MIGSRKLIEAHLRMTEFLERAGQETTVEVNRDFLAAYHAHVDKHLRAEDRKQHVPNWLEGRL